MFAERPLEKLWQLSDNYFKLKNPSVCTNQYKFIATRGLIFLNFGKYMIALKLSSILKGKALYKFVIKADPGLPASHDERFHVKDLKYKNTSYLKTKLKVLDYNKKLKKSEQKKNVRKLKRLVEAFKAEGHLMSRADFEVLLRHENIGKGKVFFEKVKILDSASALRFLCKMTSNSLVLVSYNYHLKTLTHNVLDQSLVDLLQNPQALIADFRVIKSYLTPHGAKIALLVQNYPLVSFTFHILDLNFASEKLTLLGSFALPTSVCFARLLKCFDDRFLIMTNEKSICLSIIKKDKGPVKTKSPNGSNNPGNPFAKGSVAFQSEALDLAALFAQEGFLFVRPLKVFNVAGSLLFVFPQRIFRVDYASKTISSGYQVATGFFHSAKCKDGQLYLSHENSLICLDLGTRSGHQLIPLETQAIDGFALSATKGLVIIFSQNTHIYDKKIDITIYRNRPELTSTNLFAGNLTEFFFYFSRELRESDSLDPSHGLRQPRAANSNQPQPQITNTFELVAQNIADPLVRHCALYRLAIFKQNRALAESQKQAFVRLTSPPGPLLDCLCNKDAFCAEPGCKALLSKLELRYLNAKCQRGHLMSFAVNTGQIVKTLGETVRVCEYCNLIFEAQDRCLLCSAKLI